MYFSGAPSKSHKKEGLWPASPAHWRERTGLQFCRKVIYSAGEGKGENDHFCVSVCLQSHGACMYMSGFYSPLCRIKHANGIRLISSSPSFFPFFLLCSKKGFKGKLDFARALPTSTNIPTQNRAGGQRRLPQKRKFQFLPRYCPSSSRLLP